MHTGNTRRGESSSALWTGRERLLVDRRYGVKRLAKRSAVPHALYEVRGGVTQSRDREGESEQIVQSTVRRTYAHNSVSVHTLGVDLRNIGEGITL